MPEADLLTNLVLALSVAAIGGLVSTALKQSPIIGYLLAGIIIGPFTPGPVSNVEIISQLANIGVIFLMFAVGVQISIKEILSYGKLVLIGAPLQVLAVILIAMGIGRLIRMDTGTSLVLGFVVAISSSVVISKVLEDSGEGSADHGGIALAWSTIQDILSIIMVAVMPLFSSVGTDNNSVLLSMVKTFGFLVIAFGGGFFVLPWFMNRLALLRNREVLLLATAAVALIAAVGASMFGLSVALGAFVAGLIVSESEISHQILGDIVPIRDVFSALFFVSIGMLLDPRMIISDWHLVVLGLVLILIVKSLISTGIMLAMGYAIKTSVLVGLLLAQCAEFSFLLASIGRDLELLSENSFKLMLAATTISVIINPFIYRLRAPIVSFVNNLISANNIPQPTQYATPDIDLPDRRHAVLCGYGRVGAVVGAALRRRGFPFVVIEEDPRIIKELRRRGIPAIIGNAANMSVLSAANVESARILIIAISDAVATRIAVENAKALNPNIDIVARAQSAKERDYLRHRRVSHVVLGEMELALEITRFTLHRFGVSGGEVQAILQGLRERSEAELGSGSLYDL